MVLDPRERDRGDAEDDARVDLRRALLDAIRSREGPHWTDFLALEARSVDQALEFLLTWVAWRELSERELRLAALLDSPSAQRALRGRAGAGWEDLTALTISLARGVAALVRASCPAFSADALGPALEAAARAPSEAAIERVGELLAPVLQGPLSLKRSRLALVLDEVAQLFLDLALGRPADVAGEHEARLLEQVEALRAAGQAPALIRALLRFGS